MSNSVNWIWNNQDLRNRLYLHKDKQRRKILDAERAKRDISATLDSDVEKYLQRGGRIDRIETPEPNPLRSLQIDHALASH
jgi:hypothetical protein